MKFIYSALIGTLSARKTINDAYPNDPRDLLGFEDYQPDEVKLELMLIELR